MKPFTEDLRYIYDLGRDSVVLDLGCYEGDFAATIHEKYGCRVFSFEPVPEFFERCYRRFAGNPNIRVINAAIGDAEGTAKLGVKGSMSGVFTHDSNSRAEARMMTLDQAMSDLGIESAELIKFNVEGSEFPILEDMLAKGTAPSFRDLQIQFHSVVPDCNQRYHAIGDGLSKTHELTYHAPWCWENWRLK